MSVFQQLPCKTYLVNNTLYQKSSYNTITLGGADTILWYEDANLNHFSENIAIALQKAIVDSMPTYIYAYRPTFDDLSHKYGNNSKEAKSHFEELDNIIATLCEEYKDQSITFIVSADHGFMDTSPEKTLCLTQEIMDCLHQIPTGERRYLYFYVAPEKIELFTDLMSVLLDGHGYLYETQKLIESGIFGIGSIHPELEYRLGNYILIMDDDWCCVFDAPGISHSKKIGDHGRLSEDEMLCPLILI